MVILVNGELTRKPGGGVRKPIPPVPSIPLPPRLDILAHWWDFSDLSTLSQDVAGTLPITTDGQSINRLDNKGTAGSFLDSVVQGRPPTWRDGPIGPFGLGYGEFLIVPDFMILSNLNYPAGITPDVNGITTGIIFKAFSTVAIANRLAGQISGAWVLNEISQSASINNFRTRFDQFPTSGGGVYGIANPGFLTYAALISYPIDISIAFGIRYLSPGPEATFGNLGGTNQALQAIAATGSADIRSVPGGTQLNHHENLVWDGQLNGSERQAFYDYADAKYGAMPF